jgi:hypothetical protein
MASFNSPSDQPKGILLTVEFSLGRRYAIRFGTALQAMSLTAFSLEAIAKIEPIQITQWHHRIALKFN